MRAAAIAAALGGAVFIAIGFVVQQHAAAAEPPDERLSFRLLTHLVRRPIWLAGIGSMVVGQILGAMALDFGSLALVTPVMATNLAFALPLSAFWHRRWFGAREWVGVSCLLAGLTVFVVAGDPSGGETSRLPWPNWVIAGSSIAAVAALLVLRARRSPPALQATFLAAAAGCLYGLQDALTQRTEADFGHGIATIVTTWPAYTLLAVAVVALLLGQSAFEAAPLAASLPAITMAEPLTGICFGAGVYGDHLNTSAPALVAEIAGISAMIAGVVLVARSPLVSGAARHMHDSDEAAERAA